MTHKNNFNGIQIKRIILEKNCSNHTDKRTKDESGSKNAESSVAGKFESDVLEARWKQFNKKFYKTTHIIILIFWMLIAFIIYIAFSDKAKYYNKGNLILIIGSLGTSEILIVAALLRFFYKIHWFKKMKNLRKEELESSLKK